MRRALIPLVVLLSVTGALAQQTPNLNSGCGVLRTDTADYTNAVTYLFAGEPLYLGGAVGSPI
jgi:hypothetical protein